jgi:hypothetical protein
MFRFIIVFNQAYLQSKPCSRRMVIIWLGRICRKSTLADGKIPEPSDIPGKIEIASQTVRAGNRTGTG